MVCHTHGGAAPQVKKAAENRIREYVQRMVDPDRILQEAARLAYADLRQLYDENGRLLPIKQWPDDLAAAVGGVEVVKRNMDPHDGKVEDVVKVKLWDKLKALEVLAKNQGILKDQVLHDGVLEVRWKGE
jgi:phage terminase small subunit